MSVSGVMFAINAIERTHSFYMTKGGRRTLLFTINGYGWPLLAANRTEYDNRLVLREFEIAVNAIVAIAVVGISVIVFRWLRFRSSRGRTSS